MNAKQEPQASGRPVAGTATAAPPTPRIGQ